VTSIWGEGSGAEDATQVAAELLNNGCLHGAGRVRVQARINRQSMTLRVSTP
jgi:hypothetical protein